MSKHTGTPWNVAGNEIFSSDNDAMIATVWSGAASQPLMSKAISAREADANAAHIVRCVNSHAALVAALEQIESESDKRTWQEITLIARAALALAKS